MNRAVDDSTGGGHITISIHAAHGGVRDGSCAGSRHGAGGRVVAQLDVCTAYITRNGGIGGRHVARGGEVAVDDGTAHRSRCHGGISRDTTLNLGVGGIQSTVHIERTGDDGAGHGSIAGVGHVALYQGSIRDFNLAVGAISQSDAAGVCIREGSIGSTRHVTDGGVGGCQRTAHADGAVHGGILDGSIGSTGYIAVDDSIVSSSQGATVQRGAGCIDRGAGTGSREALARQGTVSREGAATFSGNSTVGGDVQTGEGACPGNTNAFICRDVAGHIRIRAVGNSQLAIDIHTRCFEVGVTLHGDIAGHTLEAAGNDTGGVVGQRQFVDTLERVHIECGVINRQLIDRDTVDIKHSAIPQGELAGSCQVGGSDGSPLAIERQVCEGHRIGREDAVALQCQGVKRHRGGGAFEHLVGRAIKRGGQRQGRAGDAVGHLHRGVREREVSHGIVDDEVGTQDGLVGSGLLRSAGGRCKGGCVRTEDHILSSGDVGVGVVAVHLTDEHIAVVGDDVVHQGGIHIAYHSVHGADFDAAVAGSIAVYRRGGGSNGQVCALSIEGAHADGHIVLAQALSVCGHIGAHATHIAVDGHGAGSCYRVGSSVIGANEVTFDDDILLLGGDGVVSTLYHTANGDITILSRQHIGVAFHCIHINRGAGGQLVLIACNRAGFDGLTGFKRVAVTRDVTGCDGVIGVEDVVAAHNISHRDAATVAVGIIQSIDGVGVTLDVAIEHDITLQSMERIIATLDGDTIRSADGDVAISSLDVVVIGALFSHNTFSDIHRGAGCNRVAITGERTCHGRAIRALHHVAVTDDRFGLNGRSGGVQGIVITGNGTGNDGITGIQHVVGTCDILGGDGATGDQIVVVELNVSGNDVALGIQGIVVTNDIVGLNVLFGSQRIVITGDISGGDILTGSQGVIVTFDITGHNLTLQSSQRVSRAIDAGITGNNNIATRGGKRVVVLVVGCIAVSNDTVDADIVVGIQDVVLTRQLPVNLDEAGVGIGDDKLGGGIQFNLSSVGGVKLLAVEHVLDAAGLVSIDDGVVRIKVSLNLEGGNAIRHLSEGTRGFRHAFVVGQIAHRNSLTHDEYRFPIRADFFNAQVAVLIYHRYGYTHQVCFLSSGQLSSIDLGVAVSNLGAVCLGEVGEFLVCLGHDVAGLKRFADAYGDGFEGLRGGIVALHGGLSRSEGVAHHLVVVGGGCSGGGGTFACAVGYFHAVHRGADGGHATGQDRILGRHICCAGLGSIGDAIQVYFSIHSICGGNGSPLLCAHSTQRHHAAVQTKAQVATVVQFGCGQLATHHVNHTVGLKIDSRINMCDVGLLAFAHEADSAFIVHAQPAYMAFAHDGHFRTGLCSAQVGIFTHTAHLYVGQVSIGLEEYLRAFRRGFCHGVSIHLQGVDEGLAVHRQGGGIINSNLVEVVVSVGHICGINRSTGLGEVGDFTHTVSLYNGATLDFYPSVAIAIQVTLLQQVTQSAGGLALSVVHIVQREGVAILDGGLRRDVDAAIDDGSRVPCKVLQEQAVGGEGSIACAFTFLVAIQCQCAVTRDSHQAINFHVHITRDGGCAVDHQARGLIGVAIGVGDGDIRTGDGGGCGDEAAVRSH